MYFFLEPKIAINSNNALKLLDTSGKNYNFAIKISFLSTARINWPNIRPASSYKSLA